MDPNLFYPCVWDFSVFQRLWIEEFQNMLLHHFDAPLPWKQSKMAAKRFADCENVERTTLTFVWFPRSLCVRCVLIDNVTCPVCVYVGRKGVVWNYIRGGVEVLTIIDWLFVCRVWNKQLLVVTPKPGVSWYVCVCVCVWVGVNAREYRCSTERQGLSGSCTVKWTWV